MALIKDEIDATLTENGPQLVAELREMVTLSQLNANQFFRTFADRGLDRSKLFAVAQQYFLYIRTFPRTLAGLSHRVDDEQVRMELARTVVSELGAGHGPAHFEMFRDVLRPLGVELGDELDGPYLPEAESLVAGLEDLFLHDDTAAAVGGHFVIEESGLPMIRQLYEGFRHYPELTTEALAYFYLHLFLEADHVEWISDAVEQLARDADNHAALHRGAATTIELLQRFWDGLYELAYGAHRV